MPAPSQPTAPAVVLLPAESFVVRRVAVDAAADVAAQAEIALEGLAPFGLGQLFHGRLVEGGQALVFATHRRLFGAELWTEAEAVLPSFLALLGEPPPGPQIRLWARSGAVVAAAWDGTGSLPAHVVGRSATPGAESAVRGELLADVRARLGVAAAVEEFFGEPLAVAGQGGRLTLALLRAAGGRLSTTFAGRAVETMDVRDPAVRAVHRASARRDGWLWRAVAGSLAALVLALVLECVLLAGGAWLRQERAGVEAVAPDVERIQNAQVLGARIDELSRRRLRPFEMLAVVNQVRPPGIVFSRATTSGQLGLEIEAQTANADAVGAFESALRALPVAEAVEIRDLRLREGLRPFQLSVGFRETALAALAEVGGSR